MHPRYSHPRINALRQPKARSSRFRYILLNLAEIRSNPKHGLVPREVYTAMCGSFPPAPEHWAAEELRTGHDIAAWVNLYTRHLEARHPDAGRFVYYGLTSSDLADTELGMALRESWDTIEQMAYGLSGLCDREQDAYEGRTRVGRTHGQRAMQLPMWDAHRRLSRELRNLRIERPPVFYGKMSGPVGTHNGPMTAAVEDELMLKLRLRVDPVATQITSRVWIADYAFLLVQLVSVCENFALQVRLRAQEGVAELRERPNPGQIGSSSMPHKVNPIRAEKICGLARVARGLLLPLLETHGAMWDQRDISNSSVERIALWDLVELAAYVLSQTRILVDSIEIYRDPMEGLYESSADRLNKEISDGFARNAAYERVRGEVGISKGMAQDSGDDAGGGAQE